MDRILRLPDVLNQVGIARSTLYAWMDDDRFPRPVKLGCRAVGWRESDIAQWIENLEKITAT